MSNARTEIFAKLRQAKKNRSAELDRANKKAVEQRLSQHPRGPLPSWTTAADQRFIAKLNAASGSITCLDSLTSLVPAICDYLSNHNLPQQLVTASSPLLDKLDWPPTMRLVKRIAQAEDTSALSIAFAAIAETGSLVLLSGPDTPTTLNFLPDNYFCVLRRERIVNHMEDVWDLIRDEPGNMPRTVNIITGPSRTADVEQTIQLGAHGPRRLHVFLLE